MILNLLIILSGLLTYLFKDKILDRSLRANSNSGHPVPRKIREGRIIAISVLLILWGIFGLFS